MLRKNSLFGCPGLAFLNNGAILGMDTLGHLACYPTTLEWCPGALVSHNSAIWEKLGHVRLH